MQRTLPPLLTPLLLGMVLFAQGQDSTRQTVGLVLSGGGAKGLAYIGILQALEEAEIPIDYVAGTSMGGVIGGFYAAGYSPEQLEEMVTSDEFLDWINGNIPKEYSFFFTGSSPSPASLTLELEVKEGGPALSTFLASDLSLNFTLAEKLAPANQLSGENFDRLFLPFRTTASEVFSEESLWIKSGKLDQAIRATMSVPLFYRPIKIDGKYVFDGGIYNNFPVDSMRATFKPDIIIAANVSDKNFLQYPSEDEDVLVSQALVYALVKKSDTLLGKQDIYLEPNLEGLSALDFDQAELLMERGYEEAQKRMGLLLQSVHRRVPKDSLQARRTSYWKKALPIQITGIQTKDIPDRQANYILKYLKGTENTLSLDKLKANYYRLASEPFFKQIYPEIQFDSISNAYSFDIGLKAENLLEFRLGLLAASRGIGYIYADAEYTVLGSTLTKIMANGYAGDFYTSAHLRSKTFFPGYPYLYVEPSYTYNNWNYGDAKDFLFQDDDQAPLNRIDRTFRLDIGTAVGNSGKLIATAAYFFNIDRYLNPTQVNSGVEESLDKLNFNGLWTGLTYEKDNMNTRQYAKEGASHTFSISYVAAREKYTPSLDSLSLFPFEQNRFWWNISAEGERYFPPFGNLYLGYHLKAYYSSLPAMSNHANTLLYAGEAQPFVESTTRYQTRFRSNAYGMAGLRMVWEVGKKWDYRAEAYFINRVGEIQEMANQQVDFQYEVWNPSYALTTGLVYHSAIGPVAARLNYLDSPQRNVQFLIHIGYILQNRRLFE